MDELSDQISERLKTEREAAGLSVDDVIFQTHIPRAVVVALEEGDFSIFSSPTYAKSFLAQYSTFLNVEADVWLDALQPASFVPGETVLPLWQSPTGKGEFMAASKSFSANWVSAISLLAASCALLYFAMKLYSHFEERFGEEELSQRSVHSEERRSVTVVTPADPVPTEPEAPVPRARIVRSDEP